MAVQQQPKDEKATDAGAGEDIDDEAEPPQDEEANIGIQQQQSRRIHFGDRRSCYPFLAYKAVQLITMFSGLVINTTEMGSPVTLDLLLVVTALLVLAESEPKEKLRDAALFIQHSSEPEIPIEEIPQLPDRSIHQRIFVPDAFHHLMSILACMCLLCSVKNFFVRLFS